MQHYDSTAVGIIAVAAGERELRDQRQQRATAQRELEVLRAIIRPSELLAVLGRPVS